MVRRETPHARQGVFAGIAHVLASFDAIRAVRPQRFDQGIEARAIEGQPLAAQIVAFHDLPLSFSIELLYQSWIRFSGRSFGKRVLWKVARCDGIGYTNHTTQTSLRTEGAAKQSRCAGVGRERPVVGSQGRFRAFLKTVGKEEQGSL